ncbi:MAG: PilZ domain-containing protein [Devosia sp.]
MLTRRENRLLPRRNTMIVATIVYDNGRSRLDCVIRNLSDGGAKLEFATVRGIPQSFDLLVPGHRAHHCRVAWRALKELGVQFVPTAG